MLKDAGEAEEDTGVERHLLVDAVDVGAVAAKFARQPDAGAMLLTGDVADTVTDVHWHSCRTAFPYSVPYTLLYIRKNVGNLLALSRL